jgi:16S rRNA (guanine527-N7)-methyltransferase
MGTGAPRQDSQGGQAALAPLVEGAAALGLALDAGQLATFARYRDLLLEWNARINLTSITEPDAVLTLHFLDSLAVARAVPEALRAGEALVVDIGSGGGFPGLPLAVAFPRWRVTLVEATGKKVRFLEHAVGALRLANARPVAGRAEALAHAPEHRARYDVVTARALAPLPTLLEYCEPVARAGGVTVAPKKGDLDAELAAGRAAAQQLGGAMEDPIPIAPPGLADGRVLVVVRQERLSLPLYPRAAGAPQKRPLGR